MSCDIETPSKDDQPKASGKGYGRSKWLMVAAMALAGLVGWTSPTKGTLGFLLVALGLIGLLLFLRATGSRTRWLSVKVHPGMVVLLTTLFLVLLASELSLRIFLFQKFPDFERMSPVRLGYKIRPHARLVSRSQQPRRFRISPGHDCNRSQQPGIPGPGTDV